VVKNQPAHEERVIFFVSGKDKEDFRKMCKEKTNAKKNGVITMSQEIRRLMKRELQRWTLGSPF